MNYLLALVFNELFDYFYMFSLKFLGAIEMYFATDFTQYGFQLAGQ